jgi:KipI family sensor histidine kinase inhibitor
MCERLALVNTSRVHRMWNIAPAGDRALLVTLGRSIDRELLGQVLALDQALQDRRPRGLLSTVPAYASLLCRFDPGVTDAARLEASIRQLEGRLDASIPSGSIVDVPTRYDGPDLAEVALKTKMTPANVIEAHAGREYLVYCIGFAPGFTYCGALPDQLVVPRLASPRLRVSAGSIGIAGRQTGIYAVESPGGWNLIGRTALRLFDPAADPPARFKPGDRLRFVPTS